MFAISSEIAKIAALLLAIFIPAITVYWNFRREAMKANQPPNVGQAGLIAIGGSLTSERGMVDWIESQRALAREIRLNREVHEDQARSMKRIADALDDISQHAKRRD